MNGGIGGASCNYFDSNIDGDIEGNVATTSVAI